MKNRALSWTYSKAKKVTLPLIGLTVIGTLVSALSVGVSWISKIVLDAAMKGMAEGKEVLISAGTALAVVLISQLGLQIVYTLCNVHINGKLNINLRLEIFESLIKKDLLYVEKYHSGELLNRIHSDVGVICNAIVGIIPSIFSLITQIVLSFVALYALDPVYSLICIVVGPLMLLSAKIYRSRIKGLHKACQESDGKMRSFMQECLQNFLVIKSFGNEKEVIGCSRKLQLVNFDNNIKKTKVGISVSILFFIAMTFGYYFTLAWGAVKISLGLATVGTLVAMLQLVSKIEIPFKGLSSIFPQYYSMSASAERIMELLDLPGEPEHENLVNSEEVYRNMSDLEFENITFFYSDDKEKVLDNFSHTIKKGEFVAIRGTSGIGKSTLLKLLLGVLTPSDGEIWINLQSGDKISAAQVDKKLYAYVPQGNMILSGTIRDNILFGSGEDVSEERIIEAAKTACIWDLIESLPEGLDTVLGEKGLGLSEGQIQRIAIARAMYYGAPVLLLDEATSALDEKTEVEVLKNIRAKTDKTCVVVTHKKTALAFCDNEIVMQVEKVKN